MFFFRTKSFLIVESTEILNFSPKKNWKKIFPPKFWRVLATIQLFFELLSSTKIPPFSREFLQTFGVCCPQSSENHSGAPINKTSNRSVSLGSASSENFAGKIKNCPFPDSLHIQQHCKTKDFQEKWVPASAN